MPWTLDVIVKILGTWKHGCVLNDEGWISYKHLSIFVSYNNELCASLVARLDT